jgi:hypothetical protein
VGEVEEGPRWEETPLGCGLAPLGIRGPLGGVPVPVEVEGGGVSQCPRGAPLGPGLAGTPPLGIRRPLWVSVPFPAACPVCLPFGCRSGAPFAIAPFAIAPFAIAPFAIGRAPFGRVAPFGSAPFGSAPFGCRGWGCAPVRWGCAPVRWGVGVPTVPLGPGLLDMTISC